jgi:hypothetical protein
VQLVDTPTTGELETQLVALRLGYALASRILQCSSRGSIGNRHLRHPPNIITNTRPRSLVTAGSPALLPECRQSRRGPDDRGGTQPSVESQASGIPQSWSGKCVSVGTHLRELGKALAMIKTEGYGNGVIVPDKLRQFLTNLADMLPGEKSDAKIAKEKQIRQLAGAILDYERMLSQVYSNQGIGVWEKELAFRFRETTRDIVAALVLLEKEGRASRTRLAGYWTLRVPPQNNKTEVFTSHEDQRRV